MAVIALIAADNRQKPLEANRIIGLVDSIEPTTPQEEVELLKARTVFHTSFGNLKTAAEASTRLVQMERLLATRGSLIQSLRWQSKPLTFTNDIGAAMVAIEESYKLAARLELRHEMLAAALYGVDMAIDTENHALAKAWGEIATEAGSGLALYTSQRSNLAYLTARIAAMSGDASEARLWLNAARIPDSHAVARRSEEPFLALDVHLRIACQQPVPRQLIDRLLKLHDKTLGRGVRDFETAVLVGALARRGEANRARQVYDRYVASRRSRLQYHSVLVTASAIVNSSGL